MATAEHADRPPAGPDPAHCRGAKDYALQRLESADSPLSPAGLADEYGCGGSHMRSVLSELARQGEVDRVAQGQYVATEAEAETDSSHDAADAGGSDGSLPVDDQDEFMSTAELYEEQHSGVSDASGGEDAGGDAGSEVEVVDADDPDDDPDGDAVSAPSPSLPMDPKTLGMLLAAALVLWLAYRALSGDGDGSGGSDGSDDSGAVEELEEEAEDMAGGLTG